MLIPTAEEIVLALKPTLGEVTVSIKPDDEIPEESVYSISPTGLVFRQLDMEVSSILGKKTVRGWQAYTMTTIYGSSWDPPDSEEVEIGVPCRNLVYAIAAAAAHVVLQVILQDMEDNIHVREIGSISDEVPF